MGKSRAGPAGEHGSHAAAEGREETWRGEGVHAVMDSMEMSGTGVAAESRRADTCRVDLGGGDDPVLRHRQGHHGPPLVVRD